MNLHIKTGLGIKNYVLDPNSNVEYEIFLTDFYVPLRGHPQTCRGRIP